MLAASVTILLDLSLILGEEDSKIVGGETAKKPYPYQISLQVKVPVFIAFFPTGKNEWMHNCGGKLIARPGFSVLIAFAGLQVRS